MEENGGLMKITTDMANLTEQDSKLYFNIPHGKYVILTVGDTGKGMSQEVVDRMFDPFFTTKEVNKGTGLGLSVVHGIIEDHNGKIKVYSEPGVGTTIKIFLPAVASENDILKTVNKSFLRKGNERILIVDDDVSITKILSGMLETMNYEVIIINDPQEVMGIIQNIDQHFDLIITDYTMPGITGVKLAGEIKKIAPDLPIVYDYRE